MAKLALSQLEAGKVQDAINSAVRRMVRRYPVLRMSADDITQDAWVKFLGAYDRARDASMTAVRQARADQAALHGKYKTKHGGTFIDHGDLCPGAFAYRVATTVAIDYARNRGSKLRLADAALSLDTLATVTSRGSDENALTLGDLLASALDDAPTAMGAHVRAEAVQAAIATLSDAQRDALEAFANDQTMTGSQRIAKMRAVEAIQEAVSASL